MVIFRFTLWRSISYAKSGIFIIWNCAKRGLENHDFCPKIGQICYVMMTEHIFEVWFICIIPCFFLVIIHSCGIENTSKATNIDRSVEAINPIYTTLEFRCVTSFPSILNRLNGCSIDPNLKKSQCWSWSSQFAGFEFQMLFWPEVAL